MGGSNSTTQPQFALSQVHYQRSGWGVGEWGEVTMTLIGMGGRRLMQHPLNPNQGF